MIFFLLLDYIFCRKNSDCYQKTFYVKVEPPLISINLTVFNEKIFVPQKSRQLSHLVNQISRIILYRMSVFSSGYSCIGLGIFFYFFFSAHFDFSRFDLWFLFKFSPFPLLKGRQTLLLNSKRVKVTKNVIGFYFRKWKLIIRLPSEIKVLLIDPVF